ncbi:hypothetical protein B0H17DRAFT_1135994 [Mycena rosella]|uniref:FAD-binding domain-containing protein n=1 Tax=Mycena rosella TaxID=1033263 RepID=A0AAD7DDL4_MYCRO|nr:hypothetical protein B0H17DRAFT_1135994 [Mycena rosella]
MTDSEAALNFVSTTPSLCVRGLYMKAQRTTGLASAIALKTSGHNVLVLEKEAKLGGTVLGRGGCARIPPNGCKILFDWGLETQIRANAAIGAGFAVYRYDGGKTPDRDFIGINRWDPELLSEARGDVVHVWHQDLLRILYAEAIRPSNSAGKLRGDPAVWRDSHGDGIIGADGATGVVRRTLLEEEDVDPGICDVPTGMVLYGAVIPNALAIQDPDLACFYEDPESTLSMGSNRGSMTATVGAERDIALWLYTRQDGNWTEEVELRITDAIGSCDASIKKLASLAGPTTCIQIPDRYELESWVSKSGRVLVLGEAAHPFPGKYSRILAMPIAFRSSYMRLRNIGMRDRCHRIEGIEKQYIQVITLPDGEMQRARDAAMRVNVAAGRNVMDPGPDESNLHQIIEDTRMIFSYDPADDADEWWMAWGRFRDSAEAPEQHQGSQAELIYSQHPHNL